jgi:hypothetical protein
MATSSVFSCVHFSTIEKVAMAGGGEEETKVGISPRCGVSTPQNNGSRTASRGRGRGARDDIHNNNPYELDTSILVSPPRAGLGYSGESGQSPAKFPLTSLASQQGVASLSYGPPPQGAPPPDSDEAMTSAIWQSAALDQGGASLKQRVDA